MTTVTSWNVSNAVKHLQNHSKSVSGHQCAKFVRSAIEAGGLSTAGRPIAAKDYVKFLPTIGFNPIGTIFGKAKQAAWSSSSARPGDISVMDHGTYGHICMWSGSQWISDFRQNNMWVYGGDGLCTIFRFGGKIDNTLAPLSGQEGVTFSNDGTMLIVNTGCYTYNVPLDKQKDNILLKTLAEIYKQIFRECVLDDLYGQADLDKKYKLKPKEFIPKLDNLDNVQYYNLLTEDDSSISESIVEKMLVKIDDGIGSILGVGDIDSIDEIMKIENVTPGQTGLSEQMLNIICMYETSHKFGYTMSARDLNGYDNHDAGGHRTFGYGLLNHPADGKKMDTKKQSYSQQELELLYLNSVKKMVNRVLAWKQKNNLDLTQNQIDSIVSACYNFGPGFLNKSISNMIKANPNNPAIRNVWAHLSDKQAAKYPGLVKRRRFEAAWYFGGKS